MLMTAEFPLLGFYARIRDRACFIRLSPRGAQPPPPGDVGGNPAVSAAPIIDLPAADLLTIGGPGAAVVRPAGP